MRLLLSSLAALLALAVFSATARHARAFDLPAEGSTLPAISLPAPVLAAHAAYLGVKGPFALADVKADLLLVEVVGVYCTFCVEQLPVFNKLYARLAKAGLSSRIKMLAVAAGGTSAEAKLLSERGYAFPVLPDEVYAIHKALGEPKTPFTMLVRPDGTVLYAHLGVHKDQDELYGLMKKLAGP